jgi:hypothetical protein
VTIALLIALLVAMMTVPALTDLRPLYQNRRAIDQTFVSIAAVVVRSNQDLRSDWKPHNGTALSEILTWNRHHRLIFIDHHVRAEFGLDVNILECELSAGQEHFNGELMCVCHEGIHVVPVVRCLLVHHGLDELPYLVALAATRVMHELLEPWGIEQFVDVTGDVGQVHLLDDHRCS